MTNVQNSFERLKTVSNQTTVCHFHYQTPASLCEAFQPSTFEIDDSGFVVSTTLWGNCRWFVLKKASKEKLSPARNQQKRPQSLQSKRTCLVFQRPGMRLEASPFLRCIMIRQKKRTTVRAES